MKVPKTPDQWDIVASEMEHRWNIPTCLGAMDGQHVNIFAPARSGSLCFYYKKHFLLSFLLFAMQAMNVLWWTLGGRPSK